VSFPSASQTDPRASLVPLTMLVTLAMLLADVASKNWALAAVGAGTVELGPIALVVVVNDGLAFSIGGGLLNAATILALRVAGLVAILGLAWRFGPYRLRYALGFAMVLGGGLGNAGDVVFRDGAVVDFISTAPIARALAGHDGAQGIVLNLADVWVLAGLALLYPLFRILGLAAQRRIRRVEGRVLGRWLAGSPGVGQGVGLDLQRVPMVRQQPQPQADHAVQTQIEASPEAV
jgi:lipoprotein signal peptidase